MDCVKGEYGLCIRRVWTVYKESMNLEREFFDCVKGAY